MTSYERLQREPVLCASYNQQTLFARESVVYNVFLYFQSTDVKV